MNTPISLEQAQQVLSAAKQAVNQAEKDLADARTKEREKQRLEGQKHAEKFKTELGKEFGVLDNPKFDECYLLAYQHGHSSGDEEIRNYFMDFVELIR